MSNVTHPLDADIIAEAQNLQEQFATMAARPDWEHLRRHDLLVNKVPKGFKAKRWWYRRRAMYRLGLAPPHLSNYHWPPALKHGEFSGDAQPLLVISVGETMKAQREACTNIHSWLQGQQAVAPVLFTDVADFAWYSRLGWLVEYLPSIRAAGVEYAADKSRQLARLYKGALVVPLEAGFANKATLNHLIRVHESSEGSD